MPRITAILFDLDNTLFHWDPCDQRGREAAHAVLGQAVSVSFDRFMELHNAARNHFKHALHNQASSHNRALFFKHMLEALVDRPMPVLVLNMFHGYWQAFFREMKPHPDAHRVLSRFTRTHKLALLSNHPTDIQLDKVARLGFAPYFHTIITSEESGIEKPDPRIFQLALDRLGAQASEAVMIGDHITSDIEGAHRAGIRTIYMSQFTPDGPAPPCADHIVTRLEEVLDICMES